MNQDKQHLIEIYATIVSQNETRGRAQIHENLCTVLKMSHSDFRPFETIKYIPTYRQALKIIYDAIDDFEPTKPLKEMGAAPCFHCGCCQIPLEGMDDFNAHILTPEHQRNAIRAMDTKLSDTHSDGYIKDLEDHIASGNKEPVDYQVWLSFWKIKKENEALLQLNTIMSDIREVIDEARQNES